MANQDLDVRKRDGHEEAVHTGVLNTSAAYTLPTFLWSNDRGEGILDTCPEEMPRSPNQRVGYVGEATIQIATSRVDTSIRRKRTETINQRHKFIGAGEVNVHVLGQNRGDKPVYCT